MTKNSKLLDMENNQLKSNAKLIFLFTDNPQAAKKLAKKLAEHQYKVTICSQLNYFVEQCNKLSPDIILMDAAFDSGQFSYARVVEQLRIELLKFPTLIVLSESTDIEARLSAVRLGAERYFVQPVSATKVIEYLNSITQKEQHGAFKALIVDDSEAMLSYHSTLLKEKHIKVKCLLDPLLCLTAINEFKPDIIILDVIMPNCSGLELAQVIRQDDNFAHIPIVFLTSGSYVELKIVVMDVREDDFFVIPVNPLHFVSSVFAKIKRAQHFNKLQTKNTDLLRENSFQLAAMNKHNIVIITDINGIITSANKRLCQLSGYHEYELLGKNYLILKSDLHEEIFFKELWHTINKGKVWYGQICNCTKQGNKYWLNLTVVPFLNNQGEAYKFVSVATDITEEKQIELALSHAKEEAEIANKTKSEFLSSMSHELRTPMNAIIGFSQLLKTDPSAPITTYQEDSINEILKAGQHLLELINEVLDLARIEAGRVNLSIESVIVAEVLSESLQLITPLAEKRGIQFLFNWDGIEIPIEKLSQQLSAIGADRTRLKQVMLNLLSNAVKYNSTNGKITIHYQHKTKTGRLSISDTGRGLSIEQQGHLFMPFNRLGINESEEIEGTGIGLLITKNLVELMHGEIGVESTPNIGSCFWIELPSSVITTIPKSISKDILPEAQDLTESLKMEHTVLYIEDNPANLRLVTQILQRIPGLYLWSAPEPLLGLELAIEHKPDLILLDINLPGMNGFEVLKHLREHDLTKNISTIAVSANAMPKDIEKGLSAGFDDYITKPIEVMTLIKKVKHYLEVK